jgi:peptidoglycan/xylan/chitin deacetylase (PgdA/CDA1 family)
LAQLLEHPDVSVRLHIVRLLSRYRHYSALGLSRAAEDRDESVRKAAQAAIAGLDVEIRDGAIVRGPKDRKRIALIFTGHEYPEAGETILDGLARHKARASFFLTGAFLANRTFQPLVQRIYQAGHYVGPHSDNLLAYCASERPHQTLVTRPQFNLDLERNVRKLQPNTVLPRYFLPPYERCNLEIVGWANDSFFVIINPTPGTLSSADCTGEADTNFVSSQAIFESIVDREQQDPHGLSGFLLLFHLGSGPARAGKFHTRFGELLDFLAAKGYEFATVDELLPP